MTVNARKKDVKERSKQTMSVNNYFLQEIGHLLLHWKGRIQNIALNNDKKSGW